MNTMTSRASNGKRAAQGTNSGEKIRSVEYDDDSIAASDRSMTPMEEAQLCLAQTIGTTAALISDFEVRLATVLRPHREDGSNEKASEPEPLRSPLVEHVREHAINLEKINSRMRHLLTGLDI